MKKTSTETEPPLVESFKWAPHTLNHTTSSPPFPNTSRRYMTTVFFNPVLILLLPSPINTSQISKSPQVIFLLVWSRFNYFPVCKPVATNSMHSQYTPTPHLQHIQSETHLESSRTSAVDRFCENKQRIKAVGYFCRRTPSWMFNRILNAILPNNSLHLHETLATFPEIFDDIPRNVWRHSPECLATFPGMFSNIPRGSWGHSLECLRTFSGMFGNIPLNVWWHCRFYQKWYHCLYFRIVRQFFRKK